MIANLLKRFARWQRASAINKRASRLENLLQVASAVTASPLLDETLKNVLDAARGICGATTASIVLYGPDQQLIRSRFSPALGEDEQRKAIEDFLQDGIVGWVMRNRRMLLLDDATREPGWHRTMRAEAPQRSIITLPIQAHGQLLAILDLSHPDASRFSREDGWLMQTASNQMALAILNARLFEQQKMDADRQSMLYRTLRQLEQHLDPDRLARIALNTITEQTPWTWIAVAAKWQNAENRAHHRIAKAYTNMDSEGLDFAPIFVDRQGIIGRAIRTGKLQLSADVRQDPDYLDSIALTRSELTVPFRRGTQLTGWLDIQSDHTHAFDTADVALAESLADAIGLAFENAFQLEDARQTAERLHKAQSLARIGNWEANISTGELIWSDEIYRICGYEPGSIALDIDRYIAMLHPDDQPTLRAYGQRYLRGGRFDVVYRIIRPDGTLCYANEVANAEVDAHGRLIRLTGTLQDITERKLAEEALIAARQEADRANQAKSEFLSSMSHELRTPMNAILGFSQIMDYDPALSDEQRENVGEILKAGHHLLNLINQVLDLARIESGRIELSVEPVEISSIAAECLTLVQAHAAQRHIHIAQNIPADTVIHADRMRFKQILLNLLSNAIKYNREGGTVTLDTVVFPADKLRIRVTDTGQGIPPTRIKELFQPFNRLGAEATDTEGTGIGLTITRSLAEMMGGYLGVHSEPGVGSCFWLDIPDYCPGLSATLTGNTETEEPSGAPEAG